MDACAVRHDQFPHGYRTARLRLNILESDGAPGIYEFNAIYKE